MNNKLKVQDFDVCYFNDAGFMVIFSLVIAEVVFLGWDLPEVLFPS